MPGSPRARSDRASGRVGTKLDAGLGGVAFFKVRGEIFVGAVLPHLGFGEPLPAVLRLISRTLAAALFLVPEFQNLVHFVSPLMGVNELENVARCWRNL